MDCRIRTIKKEYFNLILDLKRAISDKKDILVYLDKMELFWLKHKDYMIRYLSFNKFSFVGGAMYIHFFENEHRLPLSLNKLLLMDEPICKTVNMIRANEFIDKNRISEVIENIVNILIENRKIIMNFNIVIAPLRIYFKDHDDIHEISKHYSNEFLSNSCGVKIENENDLINYSKDFNSIEEFNKKIDTQYFFTTIDDMHKTSSEKIINYCNSSGMRVDPLDVKSLLLAYYYSIYGLMCQSFDLLYMSYNVDYDLFVFRETPMYYLNLIESNLDDKYSKEKELIKNAQLLFFIHKELYSHNYECNHKKIEKRQLHSLYLELIKHNELYLDGIFNMSKFKEIITKTVREL